MTGIPRLFDSVVSPSGSNTLSSSTAEAAGWRGFGCVRRGALLVVLPSIGSVYSWNCRTTEGKVRFIRRGQSHVFTQVSSGQHNKPLVKILTTLLVLVHFLWRNFQLVYVVLQYLCPFLYVFKYGPRL